MYVEGTLQLQPSVCSNSIAAYLRVHTCVLLDTMIWFQAQNISMRIKKLLYYQPFLHQVKVEGRKIEKCDI